MLRKFRPRLTYANVMATIAVFVALGGGAYAATHLPPKSVGTKQLKKNAVTSAKIRNGTITGADVNEAKLGRVSDAAHATSADTAASATSAAAAANGAQRIDFQGSPVDPTPAGPNPSGAHPVLTIGELSIRASCSNAGGSNSRILVTLTSSVNAYVDYEGARFDNPGLTTVLSGTDLAAGVPYSQIDLTGGNRFEDLQIVYRNPNRTITIAVSAAAGSGLSDCPLQGTAVAAPG